MAKGKAGGGVQNRAIYSRMSFLQQAAVALSSIGPRSADSSSANATNTPSVSNQPASTKIPSDPGSVTSLDGMSRRLATDLRAVSLKTRIRLKPAVKQTICKFCDSILIDGGSSTSTIENKSKGAKKPWADVLVRKCHTCGRERRYPVSAARPRRKTERGLEGSGAHLQKQNHKG
ncbi:RNAse P Rpr2/Rpp21/SNM1 subunit domain-containing protein [Parachaetomium inaequale]|uniref:RNAse P Rpr2/Rpp21/SNM1 subunit domain-containing protein n=1 Tax=Parachaetomium inaequale TaxID=2588326 RepID=A0AAN6PPS0_9PEZI|nr:RNAse P Rpr2/Rpp21/SNM1 subunit domain-containing protein [Parachaetomium inaequale]